MWVVFGLLGAFLTGIFNIYQKQLIDTDIQPIELLTNIHLITVGLFSIALIIYPYIPSLPLLGIMIATGVANGISWLAIAIAYGEDAVSVIAPLRGITPVVVAFIEPIIFNSLTYQIKYLFASILVCIGIYITLYESDPVTPIKRLTDRSVQLGLVSGFVISISVLLDRYALETFSIHPLTYGFYLVTFTFISMSIIVYVFTDKSLIRDVITINQQLVYISIVRVLSVGLALNVLALVEGTRMNILWQLNVIIASVLGGKLIQEENLIRRSIGATCIFIAALIVLV